MTAIVDDAGMVREVAASRKVVDYDLSSSGDNSPRAQVLQVESLGKGAWAILTATVLVTVVSAAIAWTAYMRSQIAEREARVAQDSVTHMQISLAKQKIFVTVDDHED